MTAKYVIEGLARIPVEVDVASEFRYRNPDSGRRYHGHRYQSVRRNCGYTGSAS